MEQNPNNRCASARSLGMRAESALASQMPNADCDEPWSELLASTAAAGNSCARRRPAWSSHAPATSASWSTSSPMGRQRQRWSFTDARLGASAVNLQRSRFSSSASAQCRPKAACDRDQ